MFVKFLTFKVDKRIDFEKIVRRFSDDVANFDCDIECIGEVRRFLWIPAKKKYIVSVRYDYPRMVDSFKEFIDGVLS